MERTAFLIALMTSLLPNDVIASAAQRHALAKAMSRLSGFTYDQNLLENTRTWSSIECLRHCLHHEQCMAFSVTMETGSRRVECRCHSNMSAEDLTRTKSPLTTAYWLTSRTGPPASIQGQGQGQGLSVGCRTDEDCSDRQGGDGWMCLSATCLCRLGYYFHQALASCRLDCDLSLLSDSFMHYEGYRLTKPSKVAEVLSDLETTHKECQKECLSRKECRALAYHHGDGRCRVLGQAVTDSGYSAGHFEEDDQVLFKMRTCS